MTPLNRKDTTKGALVKALEVQWYDRKDESLYPVKANKQPNRKMVFKKKITYRYSLENLICLINT